jgi:hypothetical protein
VLFAASSFGDAVANPDIWQNLLGALVPLVMVWLSSRFPFLLTLLKFLGVNVVPPVPGPVPPPVVPPVDPAQPNRTLAELLKALLDALLQRKAEVAAAEDVLKKLAEAK